MSVPRSQNGYSANDRTKVATYTVKGTTRKLAVRKGNVATVLMDFARWFNQNIEPIVSEPSGVPCDDWGYAERPIRGSSTTLSNHASGTAIDLNALDHPLGRVNTFSLLKRRKIRKILKTRYEGVIRWGGDYSSRKDEMHFEIIGTPFEVAIVARRIQGVIDLSNIKGADPRHRSADVYLMQHALNQLMGTNISEDGYLGPRTRSLYAQMKKEKFGSSTTGIGPISLGKLGARTKQWKRVRP